MDLDPDHNQGSSSRFVEESKEEEKQNLPYVRYLDRCKKVGRIGPAKVMMDKRSAYGQIHFKNRNNLEVECTSSFASVRANTGVFSGRYYYEVFLKTSGLM